MKFYPPVQSLDLVLAATPLPSRGRQLAAGDHTFLTDTGAGGTISVDWRQNSRKRAVIASEMNNAGDLTTYNGGTPGAAASFAQSPTDGNRIGVVSASTGTSNVGYAGIGTDGLTSIVLGTSRHRIEAIAQLPTLSSGTETYRAVIGLWDRRNSSSPIDGVFFSYTHSASSGNWEAECVQNSLTSGVTDTGIAATTGWMHFLIDIRADSSRADFYIDGVNVAAITTNIPSGSARATALSIQITKSVGTTARTMNIDFAGIEAEVSR